MQKKKNSEIKSRFDFKDVEDYLAYLRTLDLHPKDKKDELSTEMHYEFMEDSVSREDFMVYAASGAIAKGESKEDACKKYGITTDFYDENIQRVLTDSSW